MTSEELAIEARAIGDAAAERILTVGREQYDLGGTQKFETLSNRELVDWTHEELVDVVSYATMLTIKLARIDMALMELEERCSDA